MGGSRFFEMAQAAKAMWFVGQAKSSTIATAGDVTWVEVVSPDPPLPLNLKQAVVPERLEQRRR
jgi:hypothetical protein